jgi:hypothetical protein
MYSILTNLNKTEQKQIMNLNMFHCKGRVLNGSIDFYWQKIQKPTFTTCNNGVPI